MTKPQFTPGPWRTQMTTIEQLVYASANAALIAQCPSLYANEERNLNALKKLLAYYETIDLDRHSEDCRMVANGIMSDLKDLIETTEKLLAKCRGEKTDAE